MTVKESIRLILRDQKVAAPPHVDPDGVRLCDDVARVLIWLHAEVSIGIDRHYAAMPEVCAYSMILILNTAPKKETAPPEQTYWSAGLQKGLFAYYEDLKQIARDPVMEARRSLANDDAELRKATSEKLKRLRQISNMKLSKTPEGLVRLRFHLDSIEDPEIEIVFCKPEEFSHAADLLAAEEEEKTVEFTGRVSAVDDYNGIVMVKTDSALAYIQAPESMRSRLKPEQKNTNFRVRKKATTTKINVYVLLDILNDESDD